MNSSGFANDKIDHNIFGLTGEKLLNHKHSKDQGISDRRIYDDTKHKPHNFWSLVAN